MAETGVDFITIMTPDGIRVTHRDRDEIGKHYLGTIPTDPDDPDRGVRGHARPVRAHDRAGRSETASWSAGRRSGSPSTRCHRRSSPASRSRSSSRSPSSRRGSSARCAAGRITKRVTGDLPAGSIRDAVSSYESIRTLGEALRAQTHEHGNRMHTAVALLELGRTDEAIEILTETSRQSQELVDQVTARRDGDPTVGALLLGKASQARERGIDWIVGDRSRRAAEHAGPRGRRVGRRQPHRQRAGCRGSRRRAAVGARRARPRTARARCRSSSRTAGAASRPTSQIGSGSTASRPSRRGRTGAAWVSPWSGRSSTAPAGRSTIAASPTAFHVVLPGRRP